MPVFNRFDATYLQMHYLKSSDDSWFFMRGDSGFPSLCIWNSVGGDYLSIFSDHPVPHIHPVPESSNGIDHEELKDREGLLFLALFVGFMLLYELGVLTATRLMGLQLPDPQKWADDQLTFLQEAPVRRLSENNENDASLVRDNLTVIANGESPEHQELRAILYSRANDRIINTFNVTPVIWLILSGILVNKNGLEFRDRRMKRWIQQQAWRQETRDFLHSHGSDLWRMLAPSFYVLILLAFVLITMSGGKIGDFLIGIIPIIFAGGIPALANLIRERLK